MILGGKMYYSFEEVWKANAYKYPKGECQVCGARQFSMMPIDKTRSDDHKLNYNKFYLSIRKSFFTLRVAEHRRRLPRKVVVSPSLETFKTYLDTFLGHLL